VIGTALLADDRLSALGWHDAAGSRLKRTYHGANREYCPQGRRRVVFDPKLRLKYIKSINILKASKASKMLDNSRRRGYVEIVSNLQTHK
jgi:hypothetical protein